MPQLSTISRWYDPLNLKPGDVDERDLAISLSHLCRFNGHIRSFYSVAQHSIAVAQLVEVRGGDPPTVLQALLHDASEAYLAGDLPGPLKKYLLIIRDDGSENVSWREWMVRKVIHESLGCPLPTEEREKMVHQADRDTLLNEVRYLKPKVIQDSWPRPVPLPVDAHQVGLYKGGFYPSSIAECFQNELHRMRAASK